MEENLYFAYGSNLDLEQMAQRCPDAEIVGPVRLENYELRFRGSGFATVAPKKGSTVHGLVWKITPNCEQSLDRYEGYPRHYTKETVTVKDAAGAELPVYHGRAVLPPACTAVPILLPRDPARL